jgi:hypothetical protein
MVLRMSQPITPGRFGPLGLGSIDGRPGRFTARGYDIPGVSGLATGRFGLDGYGADTSMWQSPGDCATGVWTPSGDCSSSVWTPSTACVPGVWAPVSLTT